MPTGYNRRAETRDNLAGAAGVEPVTLTGPDGQRPRQIQVHGDTVGTSARITQQLSRWMSGKVSEAAAKQHEKSILDGQMAHQQGKTFDEVETGGDKWALEGYRLMDAQTISSSLLDAQRQEIEQSGYALDPDTFRENYVRRLDAVLEGTDARTARLVREQMAEHIPTLVSDHTIAHTRYLEQENWDSLERSVDVLSRDPTAGDKLVLFATGGDGSPSAGLSDARRNAAVVQGVVRAFENDNPMAYATLSKEGLLGDNLSVAQQQTIRTAKQAFHNRRRSEYNGEFIAEEQALLDRVARGDDLTPSEAAEAAARLYAKYNIEINAAEAGEYYNSALLSSRDHAQALSVNYEDARLRGDIDTLASITTPIIISVESNGDPNAVSPKGAKGLMQVMDATNRDPGYGVTPARDGSAQERVRVGKDYWRVMLSGRQGHKSLPWEMGDIEAAAIAYNGGPGVAMRWIKAGRDDSVLPKESRDYKEKVKRKLGGGHVPTAKDQLAIATERLAATRKRLALDSYDAMAHGLLDVDAQYTDGTMDRGTWLERRQHLYDRYNVDRTKADVDHEISVIKKVEAVMASTAKTTADEGYRQRLDQAQVETAAARVEWEAALSAPGSTPEEHMAANRAYLNTRGEIFERLGIQVSDQDAGSVGEAVVVRTKKATDQYIQYQAEQVDINKAVSGGYVGDLPKSLQARAFEQAKQRIVAEHQRAATEGTVTAAEANAGIARDLNAFYAQAGVVDPDVGRAASGAIMGQLVDAAGNPNPAVVDAITQYQGIKALNPRAAAKMLDADATVRAELILNRANRPELIGEAVRTIGVEQDKSPLVPDITEYMGRQDVQRNIDQAVTKFIETNDIGLLHALWQPDAAVSQVYDVSSTDKQRLRSEETKALVRAELEAEVASLQANMPTARAQDLVAYASERLERRMTTVGGDVLMLSPGKDWGEQFFGARANEFMQDGSINTAVVEWLRSDDVREQYPFLDEVALSENLPRAAQWVADKAVGIFGFDFEPALSRGAAQEVRETRVRPFQAYTTGSGQIVVNVLRPDGMYSEPIVIPAREAGRRYMQKRMEQNTE